MTSARLRRRLLVSSLFLLTACSESGLQNPAQPQIPPVPGAAPKGKPGKHPPGTATLGVYRPSDSTFLLRNTNAEGEPELKITLGQKGDLPVAGDWNGDGLATVGVYRPGEGKFYLRNAHTPGEPEVTITFGGKDDLPVAGDWDGDGIWSVGVYRVADSTFLLRNAHTPGPADVTLAFGADGRRADRG